MGTLDDALTRALSLAERLAAAAAAGEWSAARGLDASLGNLLRDLAEALDRADAAQRRAAAQILGTAQLRHAAALRALEDATEHARAELAQALRGHRAADAYLESAAG
jgi:hypothetical protein